MAPMPKPTPPQTSTPTKTLLKGAWRRSREGRGGGGGVGERGAVVWVDLLLWPLPKFPDLEDVVRVVPAAHHAPGTKGRKGSQRSVGRRLTWTRRTAPHLQHLHMHTCVRASSIHPCLHPASQQSGSLSHLAICWAGRARGASVRTRPIIGAPVLVV